MFQDKNTDTLKGNFCLLSVYNNRVCFLRGGKYILRSTQIYSRIILRCVIRVVLSNNKNKLMVHMYIVKNTTIFLIVRLLLLRYNYMFRPSMLAIFRLYMKHLMISYIYTWVGGFTIYPTPQTVNPPLTCRYSLSLSASCTTWRWPTLMAETCSCTLVIVNVL